MSADRTSPDLRGFSMTRRSLLLSLPAIAVARRVLAAQGSTATLRIRAFNHMTLSVADPKRSIDFYQGLFGMPVAAHQGATTILRVGDGPQFVAISAAGVTSKAGFQTGLPLGTVSPSSSRPRSSMGMPAPSGVARSMVVRGAATWNGTP